MSLFFSVSHNLVSFHRSMAFLISASCLSHQIYKRDVQFPNLICSSFMTVTSPCIIFSLENRNSTQSPLLFFSFVWTLKYLGEETDCMTAVLLTSNPCCITCMMNVILCVCYLQLVCSVNDFLYAGV